MRYLACLVICLVASGCAAPKPTPEQLAVEEEILYWAKREDVTFVKWWVMPAVQADLPQLFVEAALNRPETSNRHYDMLMAMKEKQEAEKAPTHIIRCRYRQKGKEMDDDKIFHVADGKVINVWSAPSATCDLPWLKDWAGRAFPE